MRIRFERDGKVALIALDQPEKMNATDNEMHAENR